MARSRREVVRVSCSDWCVERVCSLLSRAEGVWDLDLVCGVGEKVVEVVVAVGGCEMLWRFRRMEVGSGAAVVVDGGGGGMLGAGCFVSISLSVVVGVSVAVAVAAAVFPSNSSESSSGVASKSSLVSSPSSSSSKASEEATSSITEPKLFNTVRNLPTSFKISWRRSTGLICGRVFSRDWRFLRAYSMFCSLLLVGSLFNETEGDAINRARPCGFYLRMEHVELDKK